MRRPARRRALVFCCGDFGENPAMKFQQLMSRVGLPLLGVFVVAFAYQSWGWAGVAAVGGALVMWALLHFNRMMQVLRRAANRPIGYVDSAVMLNAKLREGVSLLHVVAMTRSLGKLLSPKDQQPEIFRWTDGTDSHVTVEFHGGKVATWEMVRPQPAPDQPADQPVSPAT
jgi:hypothetical protein